MVKVLEMIEDDVNYTQIHERINTTFSLYPLEKYNMEFDINENTICIRVYRKDK